MSHSDKLESEEPASHLRFEWLNGLRRDELQTLCINRQLTPNSKDDLIKLLLKSKINTKEKFDSKTKPTLLLELKSRGYDMEDTTETSELVELINKHKKTKPTKATLSNLDESELVRLCNRRKIKIKDANSKEILINLLKESDVVDPEYSNKMTTKQLTAELRGRGLSTTKLKKDEMVAILQEEVTHEEQQLANHLKAEKVDKVIEDAKKALTDYLDYIKLNKDKIQKLTKKETIQNKGKKDKIMGTEWEDIEYMLDCYKNDMFDLRTMIEAYGGTDMGKDEETYKKGFECIINYDNESDMNQDEDDDIVYVVFDGDEDLIMRQDKKAILGVFENEEDAENYKKQLQDEDEDEDLEISIQEVRLNDNMGALPDGWDDKEEDE